MRDRRVVEEELEQRREDLAAGIADLRATIVDKVDVRKRARGAVDRGRARAIEVIDRVRATARAHPIRIAAVALSVAALAVGAVAALRALRAGRRG